MLFSDEEIASTLNASFECSWEMVRPVVRCEIDFGNGAKLSRTLNGNVATYLCTSEGETFDIVPGVSTPDEFRARLARAIRFHEALAGLGKERREATSRYHLAMTAMVWASAAELQRTADGLRRQPDVSKRAVEQPLKNAMHAAAALVALRAREREPVADESKDRVERPVKHALRADKRKMAVERPVKDSLHEDTSFNQEERAPRVHALLAHRALEKPTALTKTVYKDILEVDLEDPYLGLAPYVLGGEPGRSNP